MSSEPLLLFRGFERFEPDCLRARYLVRWPCGGPPLLVYLHLSASSGCVFEVQADDPGRLGTGDDRLDRRLEEAARTEFARTRGAHAAFDAVGWVPRRWRP